MSPGFGIGRIGLADGRLRQADAALTAMLGGEQAVLGRLLQDLVVGAPVHGAELAVANAPARWIRLLIGDAVGDAAQVVVEDVTQWRDEQWRRRQMERLNLLSCLVGAFDHDLGQPLNVIRIAAEDGLDALDDAGPSHAPQRTSLQMVLDQTARLRRSTARLLDLTRLDEPEEAVDAVAVVEACIERLLPRFRKHGVRLEWRPSPQALPVQVKAALLDHLLSTLLLNAEDAVLRAKLDRPALGVRLDCRAEQGGVSIAVEDDGPGIAAAVRSALLAPCGEMAVKGPQPGVGLTLAAATIAAAGGRLAIDDLTPGTRFSLWLPPVCR